MIDIVMGGGGIVCVEVSCYVDWKEGDFVFCWLGWQDYVVFFGDELCCIIFFGFFLWELGIFGGIGMIVYFGFFDVGCFELGEMVFVLVVGGVVGSVVGQFVKIYGCCVVGMMGLDNKCIKFQFEFGFDVVVNYKFDNFCDEFKVVMLDGVDVYFDNIGGYVFGLVFFCVN